MSEQILIVEDDLAMSSGIRDVLEMNGYRVQLAENGVEALDVLTIFQPDLIISDIMMPEMDGFETTRVIRENPNHRLLPLLSKVSNCLIIHGNRDDLVPMDQSWGLVQGLGSPKEIRVIEGGDHRFLDPAHRQRAIDLSVAWFKKFL